MMRLAELPVYIRTHERITIAFFPWWYGWVNGVIKGTGVAVPCDGCGAKCCRLNIIELVPGLDDPAHYRTMPSTRKPTALALERRQDGACIYLTADDRCDVHAHRPFMCRTFDCRTYPASNSLVIDQDTPDTLTLSSEAGLTRFNVIATAADERRAMTMAAQLSRRAIEEGHPAELAIASGLLFWPREVGGPPLHYLTTLIQQAPATLRDGIFGWGETR